MLLYIGSEWGRLGASCTALVLKGFRSSSNLSSDMSILDTTARNSNAGTSDDSLLASFISDELDGQSLVYIPNHGNAGDSIISMGTFEYLKKYSIPYIIDSTVSKCRGRVVAFAGGGAMTGHYKVSEDRIKETLSLSRKTIVLPHTFLHVPSFFKNAQSKLAIFAREQTTYETIRAELPDAKRYIFHDLAMHLRGSELLSGEERVPIRLLSCIGSGSWKQRLRPLRKYPGAAKAFSKIRIQASASDTLNCFRTDVEASGVARPADNFDLSKLFELGSETREASRASAALFIDAIKLFKNIRTDRLHCAITAALLGKQVEFYPNSYFKNLAVYEYTLKPNFPSVEWRG